MALVHSETQDRWYFSKEELQKTPSVLSGMDVAKELSYRQQSASLIQDMGQRLTVTQLTINTAIVYMHRFYMFHSFSTMNRNVIAPCCLFLSAKLEEQPRKLEHVLKVAHACLHREKDEGPLDTKSEKYLEQAQELVINESVLLQTLGFELTVDHPHTHVVRITQLVRASKDLAQTSYFMATNSLHLTPFCIEHKPSVVACVCIHLACKWSNWEFPRSSDNKDWWEYADSTLTKQSLDSICQEFLNIIESCPSRLKRRINTVTIYKGGHKPKPLPDAKSATVSKNGTSSSKGESSSSRPVENNAKTSESTEVKSDTTLTITSSAAVVETATSKITLPTLPPLTTKYATQTTTTANISKDLHGNSVGGSGSKSLSASMKHKHREHDDNNSPAKKMKTMHASSSSLHSSHMKHGTPGSSKHGSSSSHHHHRQQLHSSMKPSSKSSSSQNNHGQTHHKHRSHTSHSAHKLPHKHHSPLEGKKSSGDRHRRSSSSSKTKPDAATLSTPQPRVNETENGKKDPIMISGTTKESFTSPPGPQRLPVVSKLPPLPSTNKKLPPLPTPNQAAPPPPPPQNLPPPPPPPPT